jgi:protein FRG1
MLLISYQIIEYFEVEFDYDYDGRKIYIKGGNGKYLGVNHDGDMVVLFDKKDDVSLTLRSLNKRDNNSKKSLPDEEKSDDLRNVELNYVKKFQKFQDKRIKLSGEDVTELSKAKDEGRLHESLLGNRILKNLLLYV